MRDALSTKIASELCARIQSGELKENDKLPSERILASQYDVSRNVIRESIKMLVEKNLVINIPGKGNLFPVQPSQVLQINWKTPFIYPMFRLRRLCMHDSFCV